MVAVETERSSRSPVEALLRKAWRRRLLVLCFEHAGWLTVACCLTGVGILLLGADLFDLRLFPVICLTVALVLIAIIVRRRGEAGTVADHLDRTLHLDDSLSTAYFLLRNPDRYELASDQIAYADRLCPTVSLRAVFPIRTTLSWQLAAACGLLFFGMAFVRYSVERKLDWRPSILGLSMTEAAAQSERNGSQEARKPTADKTADAANPFRPFLPEGNLPSDPSHKQEQTLNDNPGLPMEQSQRQPGSGSDLGQKQPGLLDQMKDAMKSALDKLSSGKQSEGGAQASQAGSKQQGGGKQGKSGSQSDGDQSGKRNDGSGEQQSAEASDSAQSQASAGQGANENGGPEQAAATDNGNATQSGAGAQEGDKRLRDAQELEARGKIEQLLGKRSAAPLGRMVVEEQSSNQSLQTGYASVSGQHSNLGVEQHHNEVPPELRDQIREYMIRVHQNANLKTGGKR